MLISRNWLQSHFETELPSAEKIAETLMMHAFELEGIEYTDTDAIIDIDVLPNRAHDCLSYAGVAREYAVLTGYELKTNRYHYHDAVTKNTNIVDAHIRNPEQCYRYMTRVINNVEVTDSPQWLRERIESIGQRSINNIVDATNYVMFDLGNPMHAFDADKIDGDITVRNATAGEAMTTLTGEELDLLETDLVVADDAGILALAGVKGGTKAEVTRDTKNIVLEIANFNPTTTRTTARRVKILTDSSKRFENAITSELAPQVMESISRLIIDIMPAESMGDIVDVYPNPESQHVVEVSHQQINQLLGLELSIDDVENIFSKMDYQFHAEGECYQVTVPYNRIDLHIAEDIIEEIGRIYGYHNIPVKNLDDYDFEPQVLPLVAIENNLKNFFTERGFSELKNYSFQKKGAISVANPLASDKGGLRKNLYKGMLEALDKNARSQDFLGVDRTLIFEIGRVYQKDGEHDVCCIAIQNRDKRANKQYGTERVQLENLIVEINNVFGVEISVEFEGNSCTFDLTQLKSANMTYGESFKIPSYEEYARFHSVSVFPYMTRDISLWAGDGLNEDSLRELINSAEAEYLQKIFTFDRFEKDGRVSYAFSLVFQSQDKTLTDDEVGADMFLIEKVLVDKGCEIR